jgi:hypothetical protein
MKTEKESTPWMTASQYARHRAISRQYVAKMIKGGLLPMRGTLINAVEADRILDDRPDGGEPAVGDQASRYAEARTIRTVFQAKLSRLEFEQKQAKLIDAEGVRAGIAGHIATLRESLADLADRLAPLLTKESDAKKVHAIMTREIRRELVRLSGIVGGGPDAGSQPDA